MEIETLANISCELSAVHIMEVYSPARFSKEASRFGLKPGFAIDLVRSGTLAGQKTSRP